MRRAILVVLALGAMLVPAAPAKADDSAVYGAYVSRDDDFTRLSKELRRGTRVWERSDYRRPGRMLRALRRIDRTCEELIPAIEREQASSDAGRRGKAEAIASVRHLRGSMRALAGGVRALTNGHRARARRLAGKSERLLKRSKAATRRARAAFQEAGVQVK
jgi:hypothetical protein